MKALVIGSSGGIGRAIANRLRDGDQFESVSTLLRSADGLEITDEVSVSATGHRMKKPTAHLT